MRPAFKVIAVLVVLFGLTALVVVTLAQLPVPDPSITKRKHRQQLTAQFQKDIEYNFHFVRHPSGLECVAWGPQHGSGLSCNWEKYNKAKPGKYGMLPIKGGGNWCKMCLSPWSIGL